MPHAQSLAAADAALIAAWQGGDEQAAAELVRRHARALARFLGAAGAPDADLDDLVQETFIRAFRAVGRFRGQCQFRTWLLTIGGNVLKDAARRFRQVRVVPLDDELRSRGGDPHGTGVAGGAVGGWVWIQPAWLKIAAAIVLVLGAGLVTRGLLRERVPTAAVGAPLGEDLSDLTADQLRETVGALEQPFAEESPGGLDAGLESLNTAALRALLRTRES